MKKSSLFCTIAGIAMIAMTVSCDKSPRVDGHSTVRFQVASSDTKSSVVTTESIKAEGNKFIVDLFNTTTKEVVALGRTATYTQNEETSQYEWLLDEIAYWEGRTLDAWARYPVELKGGSISRVESISGDTASTYTDVDGDGKIVINADRTAMEFNFLTNHDEGESSRCDADEQDDLLFACTKGSKATENDGKIKIQFAHALSAIYFKTAPAADDLEYGDNVIINSIEIAGIKRAGSCVYNPSLEDSARFTWNTSDDGPSRDPGSYVQTYDQAVVEGGAFLGGGSNFEEANCFFLIPQVMSNGAKLIVNWTKDGVKREARTAQIMTDSKGYTVEWRAGYKYLYTIKIKNRGAGIDVNLTVLPWDYNEIDVDFDNTIAASDNGKLTFSNASGTGYDLYFQTKTTPITGKFQIEKPAGGQWIVSLSNSTDFYLKTDDGQEGATVSGPIGEEAVFQVLPKSTVSQEGADHSTRVFISAIRPDGETASADEAVGNVNSDNSSVYTLTLNRI